MSQSSLHAVKNAAGPFDKRFNADVLFLTADNVRFYLHKSVLSVASTFFEGMFSLSQPAVTEMYTCDDLPIVEVPEDSLTLDNLLRYCYPVQEPAISNLPSLDRVLDAAIKYSLEAAIPRIIRSLRGFIDTHPLGVYAIAYRHRLEEEARLAAEAWKATRPDWPFNVEKFADTCSALCYGPEISSLPADAYFRLIQFVSGKAVANMKFFNPPPRTDRFPPVDVTAYPFDQPGADVVLRSTDDIDFKVHRFMIQMQIAVKPTFPLPAILLSTPLPDVSEDGLPIIQTKENSVVLGNLLKICYPSPSSCFCTDWGRLRFCNTAVDTIAAALRYGLLPLVERYRTSLLRIPCDDVLASYCICVAFGWDDAAIRLARDSSPPRVSDLRLEYAPLLKLITSSEYKRFLEITWKRPLLFG